MPRAQKKYRPQKRPHRRFEQKDNWYCNRQWRKVRKRILGRHPLCADPLGRHSLAGEPPPPATEVHHLIDRRLRPDLTYHPDNLQALCASCHGAITIREHPPRGRSGRDPDAYKRDPPRSLQAARQGDSMPPTPNNPLVTEAAEGAGGSSPVSSVSLMHTLSGLALDTKEGALLAWHIHTSRGHTA